MNYSCAQFIYRLVKLNWTLEYALLVCVYCMFLTSILLWYLVNITNQKCVKSTYRRVQLN